MVRALKTPSSLIVRNVVISGKRTSMRLEDEVWLALRDIARIEGLSLQELCTQVAEHRHSAPSLASAIRTFALRYFRAAATEEGHRRAGHGRTDGFRRQPGSPSRPEREQPVAQKLADLLSDTA